MCVSRYGSESVEWIDRSRPTLATAPEKVVRAPEPVVPPGEGHAARRQARRATAA